MQKPAIVSSGNVFQLVTGSTSRTVPPCPGMSQNVPSHATRTNEPNSAARLMRAVAAGAPSRGLAAIEPAAMSQNVPPCPEMSPNVPSAAKRTNKPNSLSPAQLAAVRGLLAGGRSGDVAAAVGVDRRTLLRWRRQPAFAAELQREHRRLLDRLAVGSASPAAVPAPAKPVTPRKPVNERIADIYREFGFKPPRF